MTYKFLLIGDPRQHWRKTLQDAIAPLGEMDVCNEAESGAQAFEKKYDLVIMDATEIEQLDLLIARLHRQLQHSRIVVATAAPTWQNARAAFRAGAQDYIRKYSDKEKLSAFLVETLAKPVAR